MRVSGLFHSKVDIHQPAIASHSATSFVFFRALTLSVGVLLFSHPFLVLGEAFCREILHSPRTGETLYRALEFYLPGTVDVILRRNPSLVRPVPWLSLAMLLFSAQVVRKALENPFDGAHFNGWWNWLKGQFRMLVCLGVSAV